MARVEETLQIFLLTSESTLQQSACVFSMPCSLVPIVRSNDDHEIPTFTRLQHLSNYKAPKTVVLFCSYRRVNGAADFKLDAEQDPPCIDANSG